MDAFEMPDLLAGRAAAGHAYAEFLRVGSMSCGVYHLRANGTDPQGPHGEDDIYYVVDGRASIRVSTTDRPVRPGSIVFVPAGTSHRFHSILEDLTVLVVFAPEEGSRGPASGPGGERRSRPRSRRRSHPR